MSETQTAVEQRIWQIVSQIPSGRVTSYGKIARIAGIPSHARLVGRVLSQLPADTGLPWHRVVNAAGKITNPAQDRQRERLAAEGIPLINGRVSLKHYGWDGAD